MDLSAVTRVEAMVRNPFSLMWEFGSPFYFLWAGLVGSLTSSVQVGLDRSPPSVARELPFRSPFSCLWAGRHTPLHSSVQVGLVESPSYLVRVGRIGSPPVRLLIRLHRLL